MLNVAHFSCRAARQTPDARCRMIKLFASDLDGTLFNAMHTVDPVILSAIRKVRAAGGHFSVATGRTLRNNTAFGFEGNVAAVCANGSIVLDEQGQMARFCAIDQGVIEELATRFSHVAFDYVGEKHTYHMFSEAEHLAVFANQPWYAKIRLRGMSIVGAPENVYDCTPAQVTANRICKINAHLKDPAEIAAVNEFIAEKSDFIVNAPFDPSMVELTAKGVNKGEAVAWLAGYLGLSEDEVAVYGDGGNDIEMLERFDHAYATSNGSDAAKKAAGNIIGSCTFHAVPRHMVATLRQG